MMKMDNYFVGLLLLLFTFFYTSCSDSAVNGKRNQASPTPTRPANVNVYSYEIVARYPHDPKAFTQGLIYRDGYLYESTGQENQSSLRKVELETGRILKKHDLAPDVFAEGLTAIGDKLYQVSWRNSQGWEYNISDFKLLREFSYSGEGWGLTSDGTYLILSDGTHILRYLDPKDFKIVKTLTVKKPDGSPLYLMNELEWVKGEIWANIWHSEQTETMNLPNLGRPNIIARINPETGFVVGWIDLAGISPSDQPATTSDYDPRSENTLNGIAYDEATDRIFVTGKNWKNLYEIRLRNRQ
jgi:glutaminyl-peptide cyclotransferase